MSDELQNNIPTENDSAENGTSGTLTVEHPGPPVDTVRNTPPASLGQMLVEAGILATDQVQKVQEVARRERQSLGRILVRDGVILSRDLATLTAVYLGLTMVDLRSEAIDPDAIVLLPEDVARKHMVLGIRKSEGHLTVAMTDPTDLQLLQDLAARTGYVIEPVIGIAEDIQEQIDLSYRLTQPINMEASLEEIGESGERVTATVNCPSPRRRCPQAHGIGHTQE